MANQYDVLGKAPGLEELNKLSPNDVHLTIRGLTQVTERWKFFINLI